MRAEACLFVATVGCVVLAGCRAQTSACTVQENDDKTVTLACTDGTSATIHAQGPMGATGAEGARGTAGSSCSVQDNDNGTKTISCSDGTSVDVENGARGQQGPIGATGETGARGEVGPAGTPGVGCSVVDNGNGSKTVTCGASSVIVTDGANGQGYGLGAVTVTSPVGGTGGGPYTLACPSGAVATGLVGNHGDIEPINIGNVAVTCSPVELGSFVVGLGTPSSTGVSGSGGSGSWSLSCPANTVMTGLRGSTKTVFGGFATVVENLSLECTPLLGAGTTTTAPVNNADTTPFALACPGGRVVTGLEGSADQLLDSVALRCQ